MSSASTASLSPPRVDVVGFGLAIAGAVLFASKGIFIKLAYQYGVSSETVLALRMLVAIPVYVAILATLLFSQPLLRAKLGRRTLLAAMGVGILGYYVSSYLDFKGLEYLSAQMERLVLFTYPFFVLLFGVWFFGDRMSWRVVPGMALSYFGLMVIFGWNLVADPEGLWIGTGLVLASAVTYALYQHFARQRMKVIGSGAFTCIGMTTAGVLAVGQNTVMHGVESYGRLAPEVWMYGVGLAVFGTIIPSFLINAAIHRIGARATASTGAFGPLFTIAMAILVLGEPFTIYHAIGTALVMVGFVWFGREETRAKAIPSLPAASEQPV